MTYAQLPNDLEQSLHVEAYLAVVLSIGFSLGGVVQDGNPIRESGLNLRLRVAETADSGQITGTRKERFVNS